MIQRARVAVFVGTHGRGSNMVNLIEAGRDGRMNADVALVVAPNESSPAFQLAQETGVPTATLSPKTDSYVDALLKALQKANTQIICLAGYMTLFPSRVLNEFPGAVLNIHPALLPKFGGKSMYGMRVHEAVIATNETESGATVHLVTEIYDDGEILLQERCPVLPGDTPDSLATRVLACEHRAYPKAVNLVERRIFS